MIYDVIEVFKRGNQWAKLTGPDTAEVLDQGLCSFLEDGWDLLLKEKRCIRSIQGAPLGGLKEENVYILRRLNLDQT